MAVVVPLITLAIFYYLGQRIHSNMMDLSDTIYQTEWYQYPRSVRRFVLLMMMRSQRPFHLTANGLIRMNLENFVRVSKLYLLLSEQLPNILNNFDLFTVTQIDIFVLHVVAQHELKGMPRRTLGKQTK